MLIEVVPDIYTWTWFSERHGYHFNGHLVRHAGGNVCIDPVEPGNGVLDELAAIGAAKIVLTNRNHARAANLFRERLGARTVIHADDAEYARKQEIKIDGAIEVGGRVGPFEVIGVPGKSPGEVALYWPERRLLVVGDAIIGNPPPHAGLLPDKVMDDPLQLRASVIALLALDFDTLLVGDGVSILTGAKIELEQLAEKFLG